MWPSASSMLPTRPDFLFLGNPGSRRYELFQQALAALELPPARLVSYLDLLEQRVSLPELITPETIARIDSPGKDFAVERALLALGAEADEPDPDGERYIRLSQQTCNELEFDKGRLLPSRQWYLGYRLLLQQISRQLGSARLMNRPEDILCQFDKRACHELLERHRLPVPPALPPCGSYDELIAQMSQRGWRRVFVKLAHGSSASGVVAYRFNGNHHQAFTTVEMVDQGKNAPPLLYNTRRIQQYRDVHEIARLIDALCRQRVHVEQWLPKAGYDQHSFDLRIVVIAGEAQHTVVRMSHTPLTNLHLLNERGDVTGLQARIGAERWQAAMATCERAGRLFRSLYTGIDLLFTPDFRYHAILEMNAFGDLLPNVLYNGQDTYTAEIHAVLKAIHHDKRSPANRHA